MKNKIKNKSLFVQLNVDSWVCGVVIPTPLVHEQDLSSPARDIHVHDEDDPTRNLVDFDFSAYTYQEESY